MKQKIAIFASGAGSNAQKIIAHFKDHPLANVALVVTNNPKAGVLQIADTANIPALLVNREQLQQPAYLLNRLKDRNITLVVLAGFLWKVPSYLIDHFPDGIINIHPALLPKYGGKGMYGGRVHAAVIAAREPESGITIHYVNENYDEGRVILQKSCAITAADDAKTLAQKVQQLEHQWFPIAIEKIIQERQ